MARVLKGKIVSDKMDKTAVVAVSFSRKHEKYHKYYTITNKFKAQNDDNKYKIGDEVAIEETRPISKDKRWRIIGKISEVNESVVGSEAIKPEENSKEIN